MFLNFKNKADLIFLVQFFIVTFTVVFYPSTGFAWTPGLKEATEAVAIGKASPEQKMLVFLKNKEVNLLAQEGVIRDYTYAACQDDFFRLNEKFVDQAVRNAGFEPSLSDRKYNPGTDTDVNINAKSDKKITLDDIKNIDNEYQKTVKQYFKDKGLNPPDGRVQTDTDFMPNPHQTTREEFQKCAEYVNKNGGTAYSDPQAASAQAKLGTTKQMSIDEALSFSATMKEMAEEKIKNADRLRKEASTIRSSNLDKAELLDAQARQFDYQASKYYNRIGQLNNHLRQQYNLSSKLKAGYGFEKAVDNIDTIGRNPFSFKDAATIHSLHKDALQKYADDIINTLLEISKKEPAISAEITKAVSKEIKMMSNKDILFFFNCLCSDCGGSLGGGFNPEFKSDLGHGPCQCNGPLTIWKTPLPVNNKQLQYDCFNQVEKMRYDEARAIFDQWHQQLLLENAKSVQKELDSIKTIAVNSQAMGDEETARKAANLFSVIKELVFPQDADFIRAMVNPYLVNHSGARLDDGNIQRAIENLDLALETVGPRNPQEQFDLQQSKAQYEKWLKNWVDVKEKQFPKIDDYLRNNQIEKAAWEIKNLEYRMLKDPMRSLPPAIHDPEFIALKERVKQFQPTATPSETKQLDALQRDYQLAYERYTRLVTTGGSGNVQQALNEYRHAYERYTEAKKMQGQSGALPVKQPTLVHDKIYRKVNLDNIGGVAGLRGSEIIYNQMPLGGNSIDGGKFNLPWFGSNPKYSKKASVLVDNFSANVIYILADGAWFGHSLDGKPVLRITVRGDHISHFDLVSGVHLSDHVGQPAKMPDNTRKISIKDQYNSGAFLTRFEMPLTKVTGIDIKLLAETDQQQAIELFGITLGIEQQSAKKLNDASSQGLEFNTDRVGSDIRGITLPEANPVLCRDACASEERCRSWTYVKPNTIQGPSPRCWLKYAVPSPGASSCCVSGVR